MFIVIEGTDGTGKTTQFNKLKEKLTQEGHSVAVFDFPQYGNPSAFFVEKYLNGRYGSADDVGPKRASVFYAVDRLDASFKIKEAQKLRKICLSNRYVGSNMGHQGGKIKNEQELINFLVWVQNFEYGLMGISKPDVSIILHMPAKVAQTLVDKKGEREYIGGKKRDIHEDSLSHLQNAEKTYLKIAELFPNDFVVVECFENGRILSEEEIHEKIYSIVKKFLKVRRERYENNRRR